VQRQRTPNPQIQRWKKFFGQDFHAWLASVPSRFLNTMTMQMNETEFHNVKPDSDEAASVSGYPEHCLHARVADAEGGEQSAD